MAITTRPGAGAVLPRRPPAFRRSWTAAAALAATALLLGCQGVPGSLAARDSFFASPTAAARHVGLAAGASIATHQRLADVQRACGATRRTGDAQRPPDDHCRDRASRYFGGHAEAYRRWAEDQVRELPSPTETAAGAGG